MSEYLKRVGARWLIAALVGMIALAAIAGASAQSPEQSPRAAGVHVEVRVYQKITNADRVYVSAHAQGGPWEIPPVRLAFDGMGASGEWQYADAILEVDHWEVDVRVWQNVADHANLYISARLEGDPWSALGTVPLDMSGTSGTGAFHYGGVVLGDPPGDPFRLGIIDIGLVDYHLNGFPDHGPLYRAALLAVEHVNAAGGVFGQPVEVYFRDSDLLAGETSRCPACHSTPAELIEELTDIEGVHALVGFPQSGVLAGVAPLIAERRIPTVSPVASAPFIADLDDGGFIFRTSISDAAQTWGLADLAHEAGYDHVAVAHRDNTWGRAMAASFAEHYDGRISDIALHPEEHTYQEELRALALTDAQALVVLLWTDLTLDDLIATLQELIEEEHFEQIYLINDHRGLIERFPGELLDGAIGVSPVGLHVSEAEGHWEADYEAAYGTVPTAPYTRETYDAVVAMLLAAEYAGSTDGAAIRDALYAISGPPGTRYPASSTGVTAALRAIRAGGDIDLDGESTPIDWDERGEVTKVIMGVWRFTDGAVEELRQYDVTLE